MKGFNQGYTRRMAVELMWWLMVIQRVQVLVQRLLELLFWFTLFSQLLMLREVPETLMSLSWCRFQLGLLSSWYTWLPSQSLEPALTRPGVSELPSSTTRIMLGMTT
ncbi:unnamed protein product [Arabidopsis halleri]